ncbi:MAG TPA: hypothetical protein VF170_11935 [Planctomycetaceae bacterium]
MRPGPITMLVLLAGTWGCCHPEVTAVPLSPQNRDEPDGIPFYLPKPLLIISKNFRNIEEPKVGLTGPAPIPSTFDDQAKYGDINARTNVLPGANPGDASGAETAGELLHSAGAPVTPGVAPSDGLAPETFYTYQIVFVPDLTQKYGLKVKGGAGEIRAAMNLVNGWQFTGLGPYYMKDSSTAQNWMAAGVAANLAGSGVADVVDSLAALETGGVTGAGTSAVLPAGDPRVQRLARSLSALDCTVQPITLPNFAEIHVYEPSLTPDQQMVWTEIACLQFDRQALGLYETCPDPCTVTTGEAAKGGGASGTLTGGALTAAEAAALNADVVTAQASVINTAVAGVLGIPPGSAALTAVSGGVTSGGLTAGGVEVPAGPTMTQVQVDCGEERDPRHEFNLFNFACGKHHCHDDEAVVERRRVFAGGGFGVGTAASLGTRSSLTQRPVDGGGLRRVGASGAETASTLDAANAAGRVTINNYSGPSACPPAAPAAEAAPAGPSDAGPAEESPGPRMPVEGVNPPEP